MTGPKSGPEQVRNSDATINSKRNSKNTEKTVAPSATPRSDSQKTWLTEPADIWKAAYGGKLHFAKAGKLLKPVCDEIGQDEMCTRLRDYTRQIGARYATLSRFAETHGAYAAGAGPVRQPMAGEQSIQNFRSVMDRTTKWPEKKQQAVKLVGLLVTAFPTPAWPVETIMLYASRLTDLDPECSAAVIETMIDKDGKGGRPELGELRTAIGKKKWDLDHTVGSKQWHQRNGKPALPAEGANAVRQITQALRKAV